MSDLMEVGGALPPDDPGYAEWVVQQINMRRWMAEEAKLRGRTMHRQLMAEADRIEAEHRRNLEQIVTARLAAEGGRRKSVKFVFGRAGYVKVRPKVEIVNENELVEWCEKNGWEGCVTYTPSVSKTKLEGMIKFKGVTPPGVHLREPADGEEEFYVGKHGLGERIEEMRKDINERIDGTRQVEWRDDVGHLPAPGDCADGGGSGDTAGEDDRRPEPVQHDSGQEVRPS